MSQRVHLCPIAHAHSGRERESRTGGELEKVFARFRGDGASECTENVET